MSGAKALKTQNENHIFPSRGAPRDVYPQKTSGRKYDSPQINNAIGTQFPAIREMTPASAFTTRTRG